MGVYISLSQDLYFNTLIYILPISARCRRRHDRMVVGFKTTYAINTYYHESCEFESHLGVEYSIQHYVIKFVSDLRQFSLGTPVSSINKTDSHNVTEILLKVALNTITLTLYPRSRTVVCIPQQARNNDNYIVR